MDHSFSNLLLRVPLFQGFSRLDFLDIVAQTPFDFQTLKPHDVLFHSGDESRTLCMALGGEMELEADSPDHRYRLTEYVAAPWVVEPIVLFGLHNRYTRTYRAASTLHVVGLSKQSVVHLLSSYPAFQINFYNLLSTQAQHFERQNWLTATPSLRESFAQFVRERSLRPVGKRLLQVKMVDLAEALGTTRLNVSHLLAELEREGAVSTSRGRIEINDLQLL